MKLQRRPEPKKGERLTKWRFAWLPTYRKADGKGVWLEWYRKEYYYYERAYNYLAPSFIEKLFGNEELKTEIGLGGSLFSWSIVNHCSLELAMKNPKTGVKS